jgi:Ala-tRNA(Pro) deacylase
MTVLEKLESFLTKRDIPYTHSEHRLAFTAEQVAQTEFVNRETVAKPVVVVADEVFALAVVSAGSLVDLHQLRKLLGANHLRLATEGEIQNLFRDCEIGAMPPLGNLYGLSVYVDSALALQDAIVFNAGTHRDTVHMKFDDFRRAVNPVILPFGRSFGT